MRPSTPSPFRLSWGRVAAGFAVVLFVASGTAAIRSASGTCDEMGAHLPAGILAWKSGRFSGGVANPPLGQLLVAAGPVLLGRADAPLSDDPRLFAAARAPVLALGMLTIGVIAELARRLAGPGAALAALALAALCPNLLAHSSLATLDAPSTALGALAGLLAWNAHRVPSAGRFLAFAAAFGAAVETKFTALHGLPALATGVLVFAPQPFGERIRGAVRLVLAGAAGWLAWHAALTLAFPSDTGGALGLAGLSAKWEQSRAGHFSYLFGERSARGFPHYFLVALLVKTPLATLVFASIGTAAALRRGGSSPPAPAHAATTAPSPAPAAASGAPREFLAFVAWPALWTLLALSLLHRVHIGVRHVLPVLPALLAVGGAGASILARRGPAGRFAAIALFAWVLYAAVRAAPDPLSYFNELAGGWQGGERVLLDSNLDWGQDERRLRARVAGRGVRVNPPGPAAGLVAANVNSVHGILRPNDRRLGWTRLLEPVERIGHTVRIVRADADAVRTAGSRGPRDAVAAAAWLAACGLPSEAVALLERNDLSSHAALAPAWHEAMAEARLALGEPESAARHLTAGVDPDLAAEVAHRVFERRATPWAERDERVRARVFPALLARGHAAEAESTASRVLEEAPRDADALRGVLLARIARAASDDPRNRCDAGAGEGGEDGGGAGGDSSPRDPLLGADAIPCGRPLELFTRPAQECTPEDRLVRIQILREAGCERRALAEAGALLAEDPGNGGALEIYGELVVRRKLGLTEYAMPPVDWSRVARRSRSGAAPDGIAPR